MCDVSTLKSVNEGLVRWWREISIGIQMNLMNFMKNKLHFYCFTIRWIFVNEHNRDYMLIFLLLNIVERENEIQHSHTWRMFVMNFKFNKRLCWRYKKAWCWTIQIQMNLQSSIKHWNQKICVYNREYRERDEVVEFVFKLGSFLANFNL